MFVTWQPLLYNFLTEPAPNGPGGGLEEENGEARRLLVLCLCYLSSITCRSTPAC